MLCDNLLAASGGPSSRGATAQRRVYCADDLLNRDRRVAVGITGCTGGDATAAQGNVHQGNQLGDGDRAVVVAVPDAVRRRAG